ncbi:type I secretion system permease/ATPase [Telmatospirillum sp.]|uniref:type I secretion system permease/ATPase n=1 Tax=Telmatospirillum sp. TaxID=2079197 RepID=UPI0028401E6C|nr:type I secretion system permease/ATPase [Telmatospirillum sp.]MDR3441139.1 type I secretion system permease/ATPase [Telmatospirillum sp.]
MKKQPKSELALTFGKCRTAFIGAAVFSFFINMLALISPLYMLQIYDRVLGSRNETTLIVLTLICGALLAVNSALEVMRSRVLVRVGGRIDDLLNGRVFKAIFDLAVRQPGAASSQSLRDLDTIREFMTGNGLFAFFDAPWMPIYLITVYMIHPLLGLFATFGGIVIFCLAVVNELVTRKTLGDATHENISASRFVDGSLRNVEALQAMGMVEPVYNRWKNKRMRSMQLQAAASDRAGLVNALSRFVRVGLQMGILGGGAYLVLQDEITAGLMIAASIVTGRALAPIEMAVASWKHFLATRSSYSRLTELLANIPADEQFMALPAPLGQLAVEGIIVAPPGAPAPVLKGLTFQIAAGDIIGVIGPSAAGKSTLARVLVGVWPVQAGKVRVDGADITTWNRGQLGPYIGYLPQDVELFEGTIAENIARFGDVDAEAVVDAAKRAGVHQLVLNLPKGYDTQIGPGGQALSGGQRQRVGLARALYRNPPILVLDEPNSNLDTEGEEALAGALGQLKENRQTAVVITHRLNLLASVDYIMVMNQGAIEHFGPRDKILAQFMRPTPGVGQQAQPGQIQGQAAAHPQQLRAQPPTQQIHSQPPTQQIHSQPPGSIQQINAHPPGPIQQIHSQPPGPVFASHPPAAPAPSGTTEPPSPTAKKPAPAGEV